MRKEMNYKNKNSIEFKIILEDVKVDQNSDHWRYTYRVSEINSIFNHNYNCLILKTMIPNKNIADNFILGDPYKYLTQSILDKYDNGSTPLFWPDLSNNWILM